MISFYFQLQFLREPLLEPQPPPPPASQPQPSSARHTGWVDDELRAEEVPAGFGKHIFQPFLSFMIFGWSRILILSGLCARKTTPIMLNIANVLGLSLH